jgi:hypothetical protein
MNDLSLYILDLVENSIAANATMIEVTICEDHQKNQLELIIADNGLGMDEVTQHKALDPFYTTRTTRKVGLGLPFIQMAAIDAEGSLSLESKPGAGTTLRVRFQADHVNTPPLGDLPATIYAISIHQAVQGFKYHHITDEFQFHYDLDQVRALLEETPLTDGKVMKFLIEYLQENIDLIRGGTL